MKEKTKKFWKGFLTGIEILIGGAVSYGAYEIGKNVLANNVTLKPKNKMQALAIYGGGIALATAIGGAAYKSVKDVTDSLSESIDKIDEAGKLKKKLDELLKIVTDNAEYFSIGELNDIQEKCSSIKTVEDLDDLLFEINAKINEREEENEEFVYAEEADAD